jgi:teichuronic acid biosynthesis glycosyltransferase TuaC
VAHPELTMHILVYASWYPSAWNPILGSFVRDQAEALRAAGVRVGVIALNHVPFRPQTLRLVARREEFAIERGIPTYRNYDLRSLLRPLYGHRFVGGAFKDDLFRRYIADNGMPDVIHAHATLLGGVVAARIKRQYGVPLVITEHSSTYASQALPRWLDRLTERTLPTADARLVVSPGLGRLLESRYGSAGPWTWVPNIVDESFLSQAPRRSAQRSAFRFLSVGNLLPVKGHADLLRAFAGRFRGRPRVELRMGGRGPLRGELERLAGSLGIGGQVMFLGQLEREQVLAEMRACDAFVLPSHYETFGVVLIEALACGKPVVATACGGPECIVHQDNGVLVPPGDTEALGAAMASMVDHIEDYDPDSIQRDCRSRFGSESVVARLTAVYRDVIDSTSSAARYGLVGS